MPAQTFDFIDANRFEQGATLDRTIQYLADDNLTPIDLTGYTARMQIRGSVNNPDTILVLTTENSRIIITPLTGTIQLLVDAVTMATVSLVEGVYDLELIDAGGTVERLIEGKASIKKEVTR